MFLFILAALLFLSSLLILLDMLIGYRSINNLHEVNCEGSTIYPRVSIVIAACNEESKIETALQSVLNLDYPDYDVIVVNDRSTDNTGDILRRIEQSENNLLITEITELPENWIGKNHALQIGAEQAKSELILFSDADVVMKPDALRKAVSYLLDKNLDHLAITPRADMPGTFLSMFAVLFSIYFSIYARPWRAKNPKSKYHIGIGAFNLVRKKVYDNIGGHSKIKMRPDDDLKLGKLIKSAGCKQDMCFGFSTLTVEWYSSTKEMMNGLLKNSFAAVNYNLLLAVFTIMGQLAFSVLPFIAVFFTEGITMILFLLIMHSTFILFAKNVKISGAKIWQCGAYPFLALFFLYIQLRSIILILINRGISWRGTHYKLSKLRANKI